MCRMRNSFCDVQNPDAKMLKRLQYSDVMIQNLRVMDETAITLCKENDIPVCLPSNCLSCHDQLWGQDLTLLLPAVEHPFTALLCSFML